MHINMNTVAAWAALGGTLEQFNDLFGAWVNLSIMDAVINVEKNYTGCKDVAYSIEVSALEGFTCLFVRRPALLFGNAGMVEFAG
ncbi:MAG: hypothetical protein ACRDHZ_00010 [Ktedonobacteraceae bacterium]